MVRDGDEIVSGVRVIDTPGHTPGHMSVELAGGDGLVIGGDALTHVVISFQHPSWRVPVDHEPDRGSRPACACLIGSPGTSCGWSVLICRSPALASSSARMAPIASCRLEARLSCCTVLPRPPRSPVENP